MQKTYIARRESKALAELFVKCVTHSMVALETASGSVKSSKSLPGHPKVQPWGYSHFQKRSLSSSGSCLRSEKGLDGVSGTGVLPGILTYPGHP